MSNIDNFETVEDISKSQTNILREKQKQDVAAMRTSLLASHMDPSLTTTSMKNIAVLRVYHQMNRIIQYTELMDKLEAKLYEALEYQIDNADTTRPTTWMQLLHVQEQLQKNMIESQKLLQPFLDLTEYTVDNAEVVDTQAENTIALDANSREKLRNSARAVLHQLNVG
jgi:hypothetical protein|nr:MAG TPA: hypothetical protein [Bacteriophage sp.]